MTMRWWQLINTHCLSPFPPVPMRMRVRVRIRISSQGLGPTSTSFSVLVVSLISLINISHRIHLALTISRASIHAGPYPVFAIVTHFISIILPYFPRLFSSPSWSFVASPFSFLVNFLLFFPSFLLLLIGSKMFIRLLDGALGGVGGNIFVSYMLVRGREAEREREGVC